MYEVLPWTPAGRKHTVQQHSKSATVVTSGSGSRKTKQKPQHKIMVAQTRFLILKEKTGWPDFAMLPSCQPARKTSGQYSSLMHMALEPARSPRRPRNRTLATAHRTFHGLFCLTSDLEGTNPLALRATNGKRFVWHWHIYRRTIWLIKHPCQ